MCLQRRLLSTDRFDDRLHRNWQQVALVLRRKSAAQDDMVRLGYVKLRTRRTTSGTTARKMHGTTIAAIGYASAISGTTSKAQVFGGRLFK